MYYLKHQGPNLSLWRAHHRRTSFMKCTFHAACRRDQSSSSSSLARFSLFSFPASIPTDKMSQFKPNGSPIKITRVRQGDGQGERDSYHRWVKFGQVGGNWGTWTLSLSYIDRKWLDIGHKCHDRTGVEVSFQPN